MKYPGYLKKSDAIGITACSMGVLDKLDQYNETINFFKDKGQKGSCISAIILSLILSFSS